MRDALFDVTGGAITQVRRTGSVRNQQWTLTVTPAGTADVTLTLRGTTACTATHAVCTSDGRTLQGGTTVTVAGPTPAPQPVQEAPQQPVQVALTGGFASAPPEHDGSAAFTLEFHLSEAPRGLGWQVVRDHLFDVSEGSLTRVRRIGAVHNQGWALTVTPAGNKPVTLTLQATTSCDDADAVCTSDGRMLTGGTTTSIPGPAALSVADDSVTEGPAATLDFKVTLDRTRHATVTVDWATSDGTATAGQDYTADSGTLTFTAGQTSKTVSIAVTDDAHDDGGETMKFKLSNASGARIADAEATGTINNTDPMPHAWLARFGRIASDHALQAIAQRLDARASTDPRPAGDPRVGGRRVAGPSGWEPHRRTGVATPSMRTHAPSPNWDGWHANGHHVDRATATDVLMRRSFVYRPSNKTANDASDSYGRWSMWGQTTATHFNGTDGPLALQGDVTTATLGWDTAGARWLTGLALAHTAGRGTYAQVNGGGGTVSSDLTHIVPFARYALNPRTRLWGTLGYGTGQLRLMPGRADVPLETALTNAMAAFGAHTALTTRRGFALALVSDARTTRTRSAAVPNLMAATGRTMRLRARLQGSGDIVFANGVVLQPTLDAGLRYDGGTAETGAGVELGAGLGVAVGGFSIQLDGRGLLAHAATAYAEWGVSGTARYAARHDGRGLSVRFGSTVGNVHNGVQTLLMNDRPADFAQRALGGSMGPHHTAELRYGFDGRSAQRMWMPFVAIDDAGGRQAMRLGVHLTLDEMVDTSLQIGRQRSASNTEPPLYGLRLTGRMNW